MIRTSARVILVLALVLPDAVAFAQEAPATSPAPPPATVAAQAPATITGRPLTLGSLDATVNWRVRAEMWNFFDPAEGQDSYAFGHSLLRAGVGGKTASLDWWVEGAMDAIVGLPTNAVQPPPEGQLGLGGTYYAANGQRNSASAFLKQAYMGFTVQHARVKLGRFTFVDGAEVQPADKALAALVVGRIAQRLIGDFGFSAVQRSFDGAQLGFNRPGFALTFVGARPTEGVFQIEGMDELHVNLFYGSLTVPVSSRRRAGRLRVFGIGYGDHRTVLKTDNRPAVIRAADREHVNIGTFGADYAQVLHTEHHGDVDVLAWGALQRGSWGAQTHRAGALVGEAGWQQQIGRADLGLSAGYSYGSGDTNPDDRRHGTFFQILPTPRLYARLPIYNMMNNRDAYAAATARTPHAVAIRSEVHALRLASAEDLWYAGGGAFQSNTFGYTGRPGGGGTGLANIWDVSADVPVRPGVGLTMYYGHAWGGDVVAHSFPRGTGADFGYVETTLRF
jgi:hypothetical protein